MANTKTLSERAAFELTLAGMTDNADPEARQTAVNTMALIRRFEKQGNNQRQQEFILLSLQNLLNGEALTPLTDNPEEWIEFEITKRGMSGDMKVEKHKLWTNTRDRNVVSYDAGQTFINQNTGKRGESMSWEDAEKRREEITNFKKPVQGQEGVPPAEMTVGAPDPVSGEVNKKADSVDESEADVNKKTEDE